MFLLLTPHKYSKISVNDTAMLYFSSKTVCDFVFFTIFVIELLLREA